MRARVHRSTWGLIERGELDRLTLAAVRRCLEALEVTLALTPRWRGPDLARLLDQDHSSLQAAWAELLRAWGWEVRVEMSFNHFGERGRIDLLAWHAGHRILVVIEIKSEIVDAQALLGSLDAKVRVAGRLTATVGWPSPRLTVPVLIVRDSRMARAHVTRLAPLFAAMPVRGRDAISCLRHPERMTRGLLIFSDRRNAADSRLIRVGRQRVRPRPVDASVAPRRQRAGDGHGLG
jgi:hypothetical protein